MLSFCILLVLSACGGHHHRKSLEDRPMIEFPPLYKWKGDVYDHWPLEVQVVAADDPKPELPPCDRYQRERDE